jgi:uncharacterized protein (DUF1499 family)
MDFLRYLMAACLLALFWLVSDPVEIPSTSIPEAGKKLAPCPGSANCVSSESDNKRHSIEPLAFDGEAESAFDCLKRVLMAMTRSKLVSSETHSLHVEFRTRLGFVDEAHFALDEERGVIQMRSASRLGYWDLGANRRRLERVRFVFGAQCL